MYPTASNPSTASLGMERGSNSFAIAEPWMVRMLSGTEAFA